MFTGLPFLPADLLLPKPDHLPLFPVIACDQHTAEPDYWARADALVGDAPGALRLILPEAHLNRDVSVAITGIHAAMKQYLAADIFQKYPGAIVYVERSDSLGNLRRGLVGVVDLEAYEFTPDSSAPIRATEETVPARIPPRAAVRRGAALETSHVMLLCDDVQRSVIEPLTAQVGQMEPLYDVALMLGGGHLRGWLLGEDQLAQVSEALRALQAQSPLLFAVGDGNHSLATAKTLYAEQPDNPAARFAMCELVNLYDESLSFEPIHRVVFGVDKTHLLTTYQDKFCENQPPLPILQNFLDDYTGKHGGEIDYIHGDETAQRLGERPDAVVFLCKVIPKEELFSTVVTHGVLPRKSFSMGHGDDKRFYLECRAII